MNAIHLKGFKIKLTNSIYSCAPVFVQSQRKHIKRHMYSSTNCLPFWTSCKINQIQFRFDTQNYFIFYRTVKMKFTTTCVLLMAVVLLTFMGDVDANRCCYKCWRNGFDCRRFYNLGCRCFDPTVIYEALGIDSPSNYNDPQLLDNWDWRTQCDVQCE